MNRDDYITILPLKRNLTTSYIEYDGINIVFSSNEQYALKKVINNEAIRKISNDGADAYVSILEEKGIFANSKYDEVAPEGFIPKTDPMYRENSQNSISEVFQGKRIWVNYYPVSFLASINSGTHEYDALSGSSKATNIVTKSILKQAFIDIQVEKGLTPIHASGVSDQNQRVFLFLGGSHSGKTTIFINLVLGGYLPVNDDLLFLKRENSDLLVQPVPIVPNIRKDTLNYLPRKYKSNYSLEDIQKLFLNCSLSKGVLSALFIPKLGYKENRICQVDSMDYKRKLLRALADHHRLNDDMELLNLFKSLLKLPLFIIELSNDMDGFFDVFNQLITTL